MTTTRLDLDFAPRQSPADYLCLLECERAEARALLDEAQARAYDEQIRAQFADALADRAAARRLLALRALGLLAVALGAHFAVAFLRAGSVLGALVAVLVGAGLGLAAAKPPTVRRGQTRAVLLAGRWALKVPTLRHGGRQAVLGALANLNERAISRAADGDPRFARTLLCAPFGLLAVQERLEPAVDPDPAEVEAIPLRDFATDQPAAQAHNCARRPDGTLAVFDYGAPGLEFAPGA